MRGRDQPPDAPALPVRRRLEKDDPRDGRSAGEVEATARLRHLSENLDAILLVLEPLLVDIEARLKKHYGTDRDLAIRDMREHKTIRVMISSAQARAARFHQVLETVVQREAARAALADARELKQIMTTLNISNGIDLADDQRDAEEELEKEVADTEAALGDATNSEVSLDMARDQLDAYMEQLKAPDRVEPRRLTEPKKSEQKLRPPLAPPAAPARVVTETVIPA